MINQSKKFTLIKKMALFIGVTQFIVFSFMGWLYAERYSSQIDQNVRAKIHVINEMIANDEMQISFIANHNFMNKTLGEPFIEGSVIGSNGYIIVSSNFENLGKKPKDTTSIQNDWINNEVGERFITQNDKLISIAHLRNKEGSEPFYHTVIIISTEEINKTKMQIMFFSLLSSILFAFLSAIALVIIAKKVIAKRIDESLDVLNRAQNGDLDAKIAVMSDDELGLVQLNINTMIVKVKDLLSDYEKSAKELQDSEFRWKFAVEGSGDGLWDWNTKTNDVFFSTQWKRMLGFYDDEIKNSLDEWEKRVHPDDLEQVKNDLMEHIEGKTLIYQNEHRMLCKNGAYKWILDRGVIVQKDEDGNPLRLIGTHTDIDESKKMYILIQESNNKFASLYNHALDAILLFDLETNKFANVNPMATKLYGYTLEEFQNLSIGNLNAYPTDLNNSKTKIILEQGYYQFETQHKLKNAKI